MVVSRFILLYHMLRCKQRYIAVTKFLLNLLLGNNRQYFIIRQSLCAQALKIICRTFTDITVFRYIQLINVIIQLLCCLSKNGLLFFNQ